MKNKLIYTSLLLAALVGLFACEEQTMPEPVRIQHPDEQSPILRDNAYYARLRAYKQTDHKLAFGWYGSWTAIGASEQSRLRSAPDSMDIISMWSQWHSLNKEQIADKAFVQQIKGTKVVFCISAKDMPEIFKEDGVITDASIKAYAKAWGKDSMDKYQYDGIDIDFETAIDHQGPLNTTPGLFKKYCQELSQYIGPASGTGRLFLIDGNIDALDDGIAELCNYGVSQAYNCGGPSDLRSRTSNATRVGWKPEQLIFTENFESKWQTGGVNYSYNGESIPSLLGMAHFAAEETAAGFGSYHMEYEYGHSDMPYKYMRQAIQIANPAPQGDYTKNLLTLNEAGEEKYTVVKFPSGLCELVRVSMTAEVAAITEADADISLVVDNGLVASYNDYYYTEYKTVDPSAVTFSAPLHFAAGTQVTAEPVLVTVDLSNAEDGDYLVPIRADFPKKSQFSANTAKEIRYLMITKSGTGVNEVALEGAGQVVNISITELFDGSIAGEVSHSVSALFSRTAPADTEFAFTIDPALVAAYNQKNNTDYAAVAASDVSISGKMLVEAGASSSAPVTVSVNDPAKLTAKHSMIAMRADLSGQTDYQPADETALVKYILVTRVKRNIEEGVSAIDGTPITDRTGWKYTLDGNDKSAAMFNGILDEEGWSVYYNDHVAMVDMAQTRTIIGWRMGVSQSSWYGPTPISNLLNVQTSLDGETWTDQDESGQVAIGAADADGWQYLKFYAPVECRYVRMTYRPVNWNDIGCSEFEAIAPKN